MESELTPRSSAPATTATPLPGQASGAYSPPGRGQYETADADSPTTELHLQQERSPIQRHADRGWQARQVDPAPPAGPHTPVDDGVLRRLDPRFILVERVGSAIGSIIFTGGLTFGVLVVIMLNWLPAWLHIPIIALAGLMIVGTWVLTIFHPTWVYRHASYSISPLGLRIRRGILWRHLIEVPRSRIQHTDVTQGPLQRQYGIATLIVYTAGTGFANVELSGLEHNYALNARDYLVRGGGEDAI